MNYKTISVYLILIALIIPFSILKGQELRIDGTINDLKNTEVYLLSINGQTKHVLDTAKVDESGSFEFLLPKNTTVGMYSIATGGEQNIELLVDGENIRFVASGISAQDNVQIIESVENLIWYDYLYTKGITQFKMDVIDQLLANYPPGDEYFKASIEQYKQLMNSFISRSDELITNNKGTLAAKYIKTDMPVFAPFGLNQDERQEYLISHHFDNVDFTDTLLLNSNILTSKIIKYLSLYQSPGMSREELEEKLIMATDSIFDRAIVEQKVYESVLDFLVDGFEAIGFEKGLNHIAEQNALSDLCENTQRKKELENRMELIKKLAIGQKAPDFSIKDSQGKDVSLYNIKSKKTILIFWASWCPHCQEIMPVLKEYYNGDKKSELEIVGISIDESKEDFFDAILSHAYNWINLAEFKGWDGPTVLEYGIHATPTIFVLDENKTIIAKPANEDELRGVLN